MAHLDSLSLYIHIPFCVRRCRYCDFYSESGIGRDTMERYLTALSESLDARLDHYQPGRIATIFIGGGTPSMLPRRSFSRFLENLERRTGPVSEFTVETNPESLDEDFLDVVSDSPIDRISMGVQTYQDRLLGWLGRPSGLDAVERADELLMRRWRGRMNRDLLAALPRQTGELRQDISRAIACGSDHISLYDLTIEEGTPLANDQSSLEALPDEPEALAEWNEALEQLMSEGFLRYEISNFAKIGMESLHNLGYWRMTPSLGIGPGAASTVPNRSGGACRLEEPGDLAKWLRDPVSSVRRFNLETSELALEYYMMGLRLTRGLSCRDFESVFGVNPGLIIPGTLKKWHAEGVLNVNKTSLGLTTAGLELLDRVLLDIAAELDHVNWKPRASWPPY